MRVPFKLGVWKSVTNIDKTFYDVKSIRLSYISQCFLEGQIDTFEIGIDPHSINRAKT